MLAAVLRFLFYLFVIRFLWRLIQYIVEGAKGVPGDRLNAPRTISGQMVKDPVCGTYVVRGAAISDGSGASATYFCSEDCRRRFRAGPAPRSS